MALRNQPYIPLYVQDYLTDEKLNMCSYSTQGVYIKLMCVMHKSEEYGTILLKQKDKQNLSTIENFAYKVAKLLPIPVNVLIESIQELVDEGVLQITDTKLSQKRMVRDNEISDKRARAGFEGGKKTQLAKAKSKANSENEYEIENEIEVKNKIPEFSEFKKYALEKNSEVNIEALKYKYDAWVVNGWKNGNGSKIKNWKSSLLNTLPYIQKLKQSQRQINSSFDGPEEVHKRNITSSFD